MRNKIGHHPIYLLDRKFSSIFIQKINMPKTQPGVKKHEGLEFENNMAGFDFISCFRNDTEGISPS
jgi:hypothetical protein